MFIELEGYNKSKDESKKTLIIELMGKHSNIILVDSNNNIIDSLKHFSVNSGSYRNIFAGEKYSLPKSDKIDFFDVKDKEEFFRIIKNNAIKLNTEGLENVICDTFTGISKSSIEAIILENNLKNTLEVENIYAVFNSLSKLTCNAQNNICKKFDDKNDYYIANAAEKNSLQINWFLDDYYTAKEIDNTFVMYRNSVLKLILNKVKKLNNKLTNVNKKLAECNNMDTYKLYGKLIVNNMYKLDNSHLENITLNNYYTGEDITIPLDKSLTPYNNAQKYFKKYNKLKNKNSTGATLGNVVSIKREKEYREVFQGKK